MSSNKTILESKTLKLFFKFLKSWFHSMGSETEWKNISSYKNQDKVSYIRKENKNVLYM